MSIDDSQMLPAMLDPTNDSDFVWGDSAYLDLHFDEFLKAAGFQSRIHEKGTRNCLLYHEAMAKNSLRSKIRARVEHVFGQIHMTMREQIYQIHWDQSDKSVMGTAETYV